jgi:hypothetical protein
MIERSGSVRRTAAALILPWFVLVGHAAANDSPQPPGWDAGIRMREAPDLHPDPTIVEIEMRAEVATVQIASGITVEALDL